MSRKMVLFASAIIMLILALVVARVFREPLPQEEVAVVGSTVSGPLQTAPVGQLTPPLPPAEAMVMTSGDAASDALPVTTVEPSQPDSSARVGTLVKDAPSGAGLVTEPPAAVPADQTGEKTADSAPAPASPTTAAAPDEPGTPEADADKPSAGEKPLTDAPAGISSPAPVPPTPSSAPEPARPAVPAKTPEVSQAVKPSDKPVKPGTLVTKSSLPAKAGNRVVSSATLTMDGDVVTLRMQGTEAMQGKSFILSGPDRVVLDIAGDWKMEAPRVPSNRMVRALRIGSQGSATRLVFDMKVKPVKVGVTNVAADTLELTIR